MDRLTARGFSLLELLVVVVIIGILASMFTLSVGLTGGDRELERESDRLQALLRLASEDAVISGRELGLRFYPNAYEFSELDPERNRWRVISGDPLLREREFGADVEVLLSIEGREIDLKKSLAQREDELEAQRQPDEDEDADAEATAYQPQIFVFSSGDISPPFTLELRRRFGDLRLSLEVAEDGEVELTRYEF